MKSVWKRGTGLLLALVLVLSLTVPAAVQSCPKLIGTTTTPR